MIRIGTLLLLLLSFAAAAHDYYLLPEQFHLKKGQQLVAHLYVGDEFRKEEERGIQHYIMRRFDWYQNGTSTDLLASAADSTIPVLNRTVTDDGLVLLSMNRDYARISMTPDKFTAYLREEHLDSILEQRKKLPAKTIEREKYTRYLKALVMAGTASGEEYKKRTGQQLEIILLQNPYRLNSGKLLSAQVWFRDKQLTNAALEVVCKDEKDKVSVMHYQTNDKGIIQFSTALPGTYLVRMTHMIPSAEPDADWESFWAAYTFAVR